MVSFARSLILLHKSYLNLPQRFINKAQFDIVPISKTEQYDYLKGEFENGEPDWPKVKNTVLKIPGNLNPKNVDAVMLKLMVTNKKFNVALSFAKHLQENDTLSIGSNNSLLNLYYELGKQNKLDIKGKEFILQSYNNLYDKYKVLDSTTCEKLLHALCVIDEWQKALKVLDDIKQSYVPSHSAYSTLIATLFKNNKKAEANKLIQDSLNNKRPLQYIAYEEWINYILRKYKTDKTILKYLEEICTYLGKHSIIIDAATAEKLRETYAKLGWSAQLATINKQSGQCMTCKDTLQCMKLSDEEFYTLQKIIKDKLIVGSDLFLKTSPDELKRFLKFVEATAPYDIVLDGLNIALAAGTLNSVHRINLLKSVVDHFKRQNKRILLLGRQHMLKWPRQQMEYLKRNTCCFLTDDLSQDDPYFITAAILSGPQTDIVSKDLLRGHMFVLKDESLRHMFRRWQWQHQWMVFANKGRPQIYSPLKFTPFAQKNEDTWHLPYEKVVSEEAGQVNYGIPDLTSWLCLRPKLVNK